MGPKVLAPQGVTPAQSSVTLVSPPPAIPLLISSFPRSDSKDSNVTLASTLPKGILWECGCGCLKRVCAQGRGLCLLGQRDSEPSTRDMVAKGSQSLPGTEVSFDSG